MSCGATRSTTATTTRIATTATVATTPTTAIEWTTAPDRPNGRREAHRPEPAVAPPAPLRRCSLRALQWRDRHVAVRGLHTGCARCALRTRFDRARAAASAAPGAHTESAAAATAADPAT